MTQTIKIPQPVGEDGLLPPQAVDAERAILGAILFQPDLLEHVQPSLPAEAFYWGPHAIVYRSMLAIAAESRPADLMQVTLHLEQSKLLEKVGGKSALAGLLDSSLSGAAIDLHVDLVLDKWRRRRMGQLGLMAAQLQHDATTPTDKLLERIEADLFKLLTNSASAGLVSLTDVATNVFADIEARIESKEVPGHRTGFHLLDNMLNGGLQQQDLVIVAGRPAMGKTAYALQVAATVATRSKKPVAVFSLEMEDKQLAYRLFSNYAGIDSGFLKKGQVSQSQMERLVTALGEMGECPMWIDDGFAPTFSHIRTQCRKLAARHGELGLVFIDYLQLMDGSGDDERGYRGNANRVIELGTLTRQLKMLARELNCPVLVLSQLSRGVESRTNKRPMMSDLRESGAIEQDADLIMMLYRDEYYDPESVDRGVAEVLVVKNRNGPTGTVKLLFEPEYNRFIDCEES